MTRPGDSASSPAVRPALAIAAVGVVVALSLAHPSSSRMLTWPWILVTAAMWTLPVALLLARLAGRGELALPNRFVTAGLALLAVATFAAAATSPYAATSLVRTWPTLGGVAFYFLLHDWLVRARPAADILARIVASAGTIILAGSVLAWLGDAAGALALARNAYPFGHSNYTGGFVVLVFPWLAQRVWVTRGVARLGWLLAVALALVALASTSSRGGVLALVATGSAVACGVLVRAAWSRTRKLALVGVVAGFGVIAVLANPRLRDLVVRRSWNDDASESNRQRAAMLQAGRLLGAERPLLGWGPGSVPLAYPRVRAQLDGGVDNVLELHNTPVQLWATLGSAGLAATALLLLGAGRAARRGFDQPHVVAAAASLGGYALFTLTDHQLDLPIMAALGALDLALLTAAEETRPLSRARLVVLVAGVAICVAPALALARDLRVRHTYDRALDALEREQPLEALGWLDAATQQAPFDPYFQHQAVGILLGLRDVTNDPARRAQLTRDAIARLDASRAAGVHLEFAEFNLGWLNLDLGDPAAAARHFTAAAHLVPDKGGVYFGLGLALQAAGRPADAIRAFALEWIDDPRSMLSPAWELPGLAPLRPAIRAEVDRLYGGLARDYPKAEVAAAWTRWWSGENAPPAALGRGFTRDAADFVDALPAIAARQPAATGANWTRLYDAWRENRFPFPGVSDDVAGARALLRRAQRHPGDFLAFLRAGSEDEAALVRTYRRSRKGYGVLALHPDGPPLTDAYIVQELGLIADFGAPLFPPKGWLPGRFLLALLPPNPR